MSRKKEKIQIEYHISNILNFKIMALTINRNQEISDKELELIKIKFDQKTSSKAIAGCIKYQVYEIPKLELENRKLKIELRIIKQRQSRFIDTLERKSLWDNDFDAIFKMRKK